MDKIYTVGELRRLAESNEFKPTLGKGVEVGNKKNNSEAYNGIEKEVRGLYKNIGKNRKGTQTERNDDNKGMGDLTYDNISKQFKEKASSQLKGYTSADAEKNHKNDPYGNADFGTDKQVKDAKKRANAFKKGKDTAKEIGLTSQHLDKTEIEKQNETMYESKKIKKLNFHKPFINENHMITLVPDYLKEENNKFIMSDNKGNEYLVEWNSHEPVVTKKVSRAMIKEESERIKNLYDYKSKDYFKGTTGKERLAEDTSFKNMLDKARKLMK